LPLSLLNILHLTPVFPPPPPPPTSVPDAQNKITNLDGDFPGIGSIHHAVGSSRLLRTVQRSGADKHLRVQFNFNLMRGGSLLSELKKERVERLP
jgi:hypothetical protein